MGMSDKNEETIEETTTLEQGFNEDELEDIMNEIENLEKEFVNDDVYAEASETLIEDKLGESLGIDTEVDFSEDDLVLDEPVVTKTKLQETIDSEVDSLLDAQIESEMHPVAEEPTSELDEITSEIVDDYADEIINVEETYEEPIDEIVVEEEEVTNVVSISEAKQPSKPIQEKTIMKNTDNKYNTQMDFTVRGEMNMQLNFTIGEQTVKLFVSEEEGFVIEMAGGGKFTLPRSTAVSEKVKKAS
jgi:hypothetical protein